MIPLRNLAANVGALLVGLILFVGVELILALCGVAPLSEEDRFVGFSKTSPLFIKQGDVFQLNPAKEAYFNSPQSFRMPKGAGTYRIMTFGGSTTYGRPYLADTAFGQWLVQLLGRYGEDRNYETLNLGGISYASYRVARIAEEMSQYDADLWVVYSGHNEFLEARTFARQKAESPLLQRMRNGLHHSRVYSGLQRVISILASGGTTTGRTVLGEDVLARQENIGGIDLYHRDDEFRAGVIEQYRHSILQIVKLAKSNGIPLVLCTVPSNLAGLSPFKSEHRPDISVDDAQRFEQLLQTAVEELQNNNPNAASLLLARAEKIDDRFAMVHFLKGRVFEALGMNEAAYAAYLRAKEEDIVALRALDEFNTILREIAVSEKLPLADVEAAIRGASPGGIPGDIWFVDHVHPTIQGQQLIAYEIIEAASVAGIIPVSYEKWALSREDADQYLNQSARKITPEHKAFGYWGVGRLFFWAGKYAEAYPALERAWEVIKNIVEIPRQLAAIEMMRGDYVKAHEFLLAAETIEPDNPHVMLLLAETLAALGQPEQGLAVLTEIPPDRVSRENLLLVRGGILRMQGDFRGAIAVLKEAVSLAPEAPSLYLALAQNYRDNKDLLLAVKTYREYLRLQRQPSSDQTVAEWLQESPFVIGAAAGEVDKQ